MATPLFDLVFERRVRCAHGSCARFYDGRQHPGDSSPPEDAVVVEQDHGFRLEGPLWSRSSSEGGVGGKVGWIDRVGKVREPVEGEQRDGALLAWNKIKEMAYELVAPMASAARTAPLELAQRRMLEQPKYFDELPRARVIEI